jgi:hypothetical protein
MPSARNGGARHQQATPDGDYMDAAVVAVAAFRSFPCVAQFWRTDAEIRVLGRSASSIPSPPWAMMVWQLLQSAEIFLPSALTCSPSWQRKQPGHLKWPMLFGYTFQLDFISGKNSRGKSSAPRDGALDGFARNVLAYVRIRVGDLLFGLGRGRIVIRQGGHGVLLDGRQGRIDAAQGHRVSTASSGARKMCVGDCGNRRNPSAASRPGPSARAPVSLPSLRTR